MNNKIAEKQKIICCKYGSKYVPLSNNDFVAIAINTIGKMPINGIRYISHNDENISWYIYCGEFSKEDNFFQSLHFIHLTDILPIVMPYLSLEKGYGFVIDDKEYEDVWFDGFK